MKNLVIVESPTKVKTIKKFLGKNYEVMASQGHVRDLPKSQLGVDVDGDFEPKYITIRGKGELLASLRKEAKKADRIYLATDPDREGEAISWHLKAALGVDDKKYVRVTFNEITKNAVKESFKHPRDIDMDLVDAQQTRRILDRIVGYKISPLLWVKVKRGLSAGRVQSAALRLICDREQEINEFIPREYYTLDAFILAKGKKKPIPVSFYGQTGKKLDISDKKSLEDIMAAIGNSDFKLLEKKNSSRTKKAPLPFTTSTMQQEASKALNFSLQKTMQVAQQLYEDGRITYLRTDSIRISDEAIASAKAFVTEKYGSQYYKHYEVPQKKSGKNIQDAHEAIRPSDLSFTVDAAKKSLSRDQLRLYTLIYNRFLASQMMPAIYDVITARFTVNGYEFRQSETGVSFDGFTRIYTEADEEKAPVYGLKSLEEGDSFALSKLEKKQHFTQAPPRFTEASLVRTLEELSIGRPSTYSPIITTLLKRHYIGKEGRAIFVTELGDVVNNIMKESFPSIVDLRFTAKMEEDLDEVEEGTREWKTVVREFYPDLAHSIEKAETEISKVKIEDEVTDIICEKCGRNMVVKYGPHGKFLACPGFPECRNTKPYLEKIGISCPKCGKDIVLRKTKKGRVFYGCEDYPDCDFMSWQRPAKKSCPRCNGFMVYRGKKIACADPSCGYTENVSSDDD